MKKKEIALKIGKILNNIAEKIVCTDSIINKEAKRIKKQIKNGEPLESCLFIVVYDIIHDILDKEMEAEKERN